MDPPLLRGGLLPDEPKHATFYERLVDRYSDLTLWPSARKTVLASTVALGFQVVVTPLALMAAVRLSPALDLGELRWLAGAWIIALIVVLGVALAVDRSGREGRWTVHLLLFVYAPFLVELVRSLGTISTGLLAVLPLVLLFASIFFDGRAGMMATVYVFLLALATVVGELLGWWRYAPAITARGLDAQVDLWWYGVVLGVVATVFTYAFLMVQLSVSARVVQQRRLEEAHRALAKANDALRRGNDLIRRYVPADLAEQLLAGDGGEGGHRRKTLTIVFSDVAGFTEIADQLEAEDLSRLLNDYFTEMAAIAERHGGLVNKFIGDAMLILFGAAGDRDRKDEAVRAVEMAVAMQARVRELSEKWQAEGLLVPVRIRIGVNTGAASLGNFGSEGRRDYTAVGNQVNVAARIQAQCEPGDVLVSHATWALVHDRVACVEVGDVSVKGIHYPIRIYRAAAAA
jgi:class 3 adenylate cyclase